MNTLTNIRTFLLVARLGNFSAAARELGTAPSVVTKRISQLEQEFGVRLLNRSTRQLRLTDDGERMHVKFMQLLGEFDELLHSGASRVEGSLRVQAPVTLTMAFFGDVFNTFHLRHRDIHLEVILTDRAPNPLEDGIDVVLTSQPVSFLNVVEVPLSSYPLMLCAAPSYLTSRGTPRHPLDIGAHACLTVGLLPAVWPFNGVQGASNIEIHPTLLCNEGSIVADAARNGMGIAAVPRFLVEQDLRAGTLVPVLPDYPIADYRLKALVARYRLSRVAVREFVDHLKIEVQRAPWGLAAAGTSP
ncbi:MAG: LysR family transcriptional regulator [Gammaproteobacteria bacterium]|nr:LysR family transcriptional regulator [Gammaproteobacteria bacterium]